LLPVIQAIFFLGGEIFKPEKKNPQKINAFFFSSKPQNFTPQKIYVFFLVQNHKNFTPQKIKSAKNICLLFSPKTQKIHTADNALINEAQQETIKIKIKDILPSLSRIYKNLYIKGLFWILCIWIKVTYYQFITILLTLVNIN
jgi:hypothetical protein